MAQVKIYGLASHLEPRRACLSGAIHSCVVDALGLPVDKRFHRFFPMDPVNFLYPSDRTAHYTIAEISMFEGRSLARKRQLIRLLFERLDRECAITPQDLEITVTETPRSHWGIRVLPADDLALSYSVERE